MPWTFAHPAAVLPLMRFTANDTQKLALLIGACAPDLPYYIQLPLSAHTPIGLFLIALPMAWVALIACLLLSPSLRLGLPLAISDPLPLRPVKAELAPLRISCLILLGAVTHIVWDSFTHARNAIGLPVIVSSFAGIPLYRILQHVSTLIGCTILVWYFANKVSSSEAKAQNTSTSAGNLELERLRWRVFCFSALVASSSAFLVGLYFAAKMPLYAVRVFFFSAAISGVQVFFVVLLLLTLIMRPRLVDLVSQSSDIARQQRGTKSVHTQA
jgi:hypothetical protein